MTRNATARLFVAVELPVTVREQLNGWARAALSGLSSRTPIRVLDMELLHVTLCFLGSRPVAEVEPIAAQLSACGGCAGELSLGAPLWLPRRRPRALAVEVHDEDGALADLQRAVAGALSELGDQGLANHAGSTGDAHSRRRRFHPHVTVARMPGGAAPRERALSATPCVSFIPSELVLYRSWLSPDGASYEAIASHVIG
jgi:RNA 2',3'-cyclic 3'-phosphodiesterase